MAAIAVIFIAGLVGLVLWFLPKPTSAPLPDAVMFPMDVLMTMASISRQWKKAHGSIDQQSQMHLVQMFQTQFMAQIGMMDEYTLIVVKNADLIARLETDQVWQSDPKRGLLIFSKLDLITLDRLVNSYLMQKQKIDDAGISYCRSAFKQLVRRHLVEADN